MYSLLNSLHILTLAKLMLLSFVCKYQCIKVMQIGNTKLETERLINQNEKPKQNIQVTKDWKKACFRKFYEGYCFRIAAEIKYIS